MDAGNLSEREIIRKDSSPWIRRTSLTFST